MCKWLAACPAVLAALAFAACSRPVQAQVQIVSGEPVAQVRSARSDVVRSGGPVALQGDGGSAGALDPEIEKLGRVLSQMSDRAKAAIPNGRPEEFLADLHAVLAAEREFRTDDLSPYYLIDKKHLVGADYVPKDLVRLVQNDAYSVSRNDLSLRPEAEQALRAMGRAAVRDGVKLLASSSYRSYSYQERLFARYVSEDGLAAAERYSARAGTSQHQLGMVVDFGSISDDFAGTRAGRWLAAHSEEYGWSLSFPQGYEDVTGFQWECWHFRYIGVPACQFQRKWFGDVQQFMIEFIDAWKRAPAV